jgi:hypothetical protein
MIDFDFKEEFGNNSIYRGNFALDSATRAVLLNSRQTKTPAGNNPWIINTIKALRLASANNWIMLTSIGMNTWELALWACGQAKCKQIIIIPLKAKDNYREKIDQILFNFELERDYTGWLFYRATEKARSEKIDWPKRDKIAVGLADLIVPVSVRKGGNLDNLINRHSRDKGKPVIKDFETNYGAPKHERSFGSGSIEVAIPRKGWDYITHWTRTCYGPWPGERSALFYRRLINSGNQYPNSGLNTLRNILQKRVIYGFSRNLRGNLRGVALSCLHPIDIIPLMRWRKRYVRWNFEPYGIAISRKAAITAGIQPAIYGKPELYEVLIDSDKPYFQNEGEARAWRAEKEWRYIGDLDLSVINPEAMRIIVYKTEELDVLKGVCDSRVLSMI